MPWLPLPYKNHFFRNVAGIGITKSMGIPGGAQNSGHYSASAYLHTHGGPDDLANGEFAFLLFKLNLFNLRAAMTLL